jgi:hypothetical protein
MLNNKPQKLEELRSWWQWSSNNQNVDGKPKRSLPKISDSMFFDL